MNAQFNEDKPKATNLAADARIYRIENYGNEIEKTGNSINRLEVEESTTAVTYEKLSYIHETPVIRRDDSPIPQVAEKFKFPYSLYKLAGYIALLFVAGIGTYLSFMVMNMWWLIVVLFAAVCLVAGERLIPAFLFPISNVNTENPGSQRIAEIILFILGIATCSCLAGFYLGRTDESETSFLAVNHLIMLTMGEIGLIVISAILFLLIYYYGWSHRLTDEYHVIKSKIDFLRVKERKLFGALVPEYRTFLDTFEDDYRTLPISLELHEKLKRLIKKFETSDQENPDQFAIDNGEDQKLLEDKKND